MMSKGRIKPNLEQLLAAILLTLAGCSGARTLLALEDQEDRGKPIQNPFGAFYPTASTEGKGPMVVRSKRGDQAIEFEIPTHGAEVSEWVVPFSQEKKTDTAATETTGREYADRKPTSIDREIQRGMPKPPAEEMSARRELEGEMGLRPTEEDMVRGDKSYLGALDRIKGLFKQGRLEAALLESEDMLRDHPTDPRLHEMKGTLLDRLGYADLARQSWAQSLKLQPSNEPLRKFLDRRGVRQPAQSGETK